MPTAKKPADDAKPASRARKTTAKAAAAAKPEAPDTAAAKPTRRSRKPAEPAVEATAATEQKPETAPPAKEPKKDRTMAIAVAFLAAVALFAVGFGVGRSTGNDRVAAFGPGVQMIPGRGVMPYGDDGMPMIPYRQGQRVYPNGPNRQGQVTPQANDQGFLGITGVNAPNGGVQVTEVQPGSAAEAAGLAVGDRIVSVDGTQIVGMGQFANIVAGSQPGTMLTLQVDRNGSTMTITATLGSRAG